MPVWLDIAIDVVVWCFAIATAYKMFRAQRRIAPWVLRLMFVTTCINVVVVTAVLVADFTALDSSVILVVGRVFSYGFFLIATWTMDRGLQKLDKKQGLHG